MQLKVELRLSLATKIANTPPPLSPDSLKSVVCEDFRRKILNGLRLAHNLELQALMQLKAG